MLVHLQEAGQVTDRLLLADFIGEWQDRLQEALQAEHADASDPAAYAAVEAALLARCSFGLHGTQTPKVTFGWHVCGHPLRVTALPQRH